MKDILLRNYSLEIDNYEKVVDGILFYVDNSYFYFYNCFFNEEYIYYCLDEWSKYSDKIPVHKVVYTKVFKDGYILFKVDCFRENISLEDVQIFSQVKLLKEYESISMISFWEDKIDYIEKQVQEFSSLAIINNSLDYFLGISEMLLAYLRDNVNYTNYSLSHRELSSNSSLEFYNPLLFCVDSPLKDWAFVWRWEKDYEKLENFIAVAKFKQDDLAYLFVRLTFPFTYFHLITSILLDGDSEERLVNYLNLVDEYEKYLEKIEQIFGIHIFLWLKKVIK